MVRCFAQPTYVKKKTKFLVSSLDRNHTKPSRTWLLNVLGVIILKGWPFGKVAWCQEILYHRTMPINYITILVNLINKNLKSTLTCYNDLHPYGVLGLTDWQSYGFLAKLHNKYLVCYIFWLWGLFLTFLLVTMTSWPDILLTKTKFCFR